MWHTVITPIKRGLSDDLTPTTNSSDGHDSTTLWLFGKTIQCAPDRCGSIRMGSKQAIRGSQGRVFPVEDRLVPLLPSFRKDFGHFVALAVFGNETRIHHVRPLLEHPLRTVVAPDVTRWWVVSTKRRITSRRFACLALRGREHQCRSPDGLQDVARDQRLLLRLRLCNPARSPVIRASFLLSRDHFLIWISRRRRTGSG